jgi:NDP-sugar pyrophosphorylase family protein
LKAVILTGGLSTRLAKETTAKPKPMVEIGDKPVLCHILTSYSQQGIGARYAVAAAGRTTGRRPMNKAFISERDDFEWRAKTHAVA